MSEKSIKEYFEDLKKHDLHTIAKNALVEFDEGAQKFAIPMFSFTAEIDLSREKVNTALRDAITMGPFVEKYFDSWCLKYLLFAKDIPRSNKWVLPDELKEGKFFFHGSHQLPLEKFSETYNSDLDKLRGKALKIGKLVDNTAGDLSFEIKPFPRIPVLVVFWQGDEDFAPHTTFLFDASANDQLPIDIVWGLAHLAIEVINKI